MTAKKSQAKSGDLVKANLAVKNHSSPLARAASVVPAKLRNDIDYEQAAKVRISIASAKKSIDKEITAIVKPIRAGLDLLYAKKREAFAILDDLNNPLAQRMRTYSRAKQEKEIKRAEKLAAKAPTREQATDIKIAATTQKVTPRVEGVITKQVWTFKVTDATKIPAYHDGVEIREIKRSPILKLIRATEGKVKIQGIEAVLETVDSVRG